MKLSEKIGYALEHVLAAILEQRAISVSRSERLGAESIKCDIEFKFNNRTYIVFVTHTRTTGMTNRKFFRTFEELAQRRIATPDAVCVEVSLDSETSHIRKVYGMVFERLFDSSISATTNTRKSQFTDFVESLPTPINYEVTSSALNALSRQLRKDFERCVDQILETKPISPKEVRDFWVKEATIKSSPQRTALSDSHSLKQGVRLLALLCDSGLTMEGVASGAIRGNSLSRPSINHYVRLGVLSESPSIVGPKLVFPGNVVAAASICVQSKMPLQDQQFLPNLTTPGARQLFESLRSPDRLHSSYIEVTERLSTCKTEGALRSAIIKEFRSDSLRCDLLDLAIRSAGCSQNEIALDLVPRLKRAGLGEPPCDMVVRFVISKNEGLNSLISDEITLLNELVGAVWEKLSNQRAVPAWDDFLDDRLSTYLTHPFVQLELSLVERQLSNCTRLPRRRSSILPKICQLPSECRMGVDASIHVEIGGQKLFVITVSTPEPRHHKHKEFSGKLRSIRYSMNGGAICLDGTRFVLVIDGNWTDSQIGMLSNAGWDIYDWSSFLTWLGGLAGVKRA